MTRPVFFADPLPGPGAFTLAGDEGRHAATVRRLRVGEELDLVDGRGASATATVTAVARASLDLAVNASTHQPVPDPRLVVVQALAKGDRSELAVELLTEIGVDEVVPWAAARSVVRWDADRGVKGLARWRATAASAAKQSRRVWWPLVSEPLTSAGVAARLATAALAVILDADAPTPLTALSVPAQGDVIVVVGPEGGIGADELDLLDPDARYRHHLGPEVLRTSTAGLAAISVLAAQLPRWR